MPTGRSRLVFGCESGSFLFAFDTAFPPSELPAIDGTIQSPRPENYTAISHLRSSSFQLVLHTHSRTDWMSARRKNCRGSLVALNTSWLTRKGLRLRVFDQSSPRRFGRYCLRACTNLGQDPIVTRFRSSIPFRVRQPVDTFLPRYLSVYASTGHFESNDSYSQAATRDTEPLAKSYSGGVLTRLYSIHFQYARARFCYVLP